MKKIKKRSYILAAAAIIFVIGYYKLDVGATVERISSYVAYPFVYAQYALVQPVKRWFEKRNAVNQLEALVRTYKKQTQDMLSELVACKAQACFVDETKAVQDFAQRYSKEAILTQILTRNFSDDAHFVLIDRGAQAGIEVDMIVVYKNCLVGRVSAVYPWYSKVVLVTDRLCKVPAISVEHKARGIYMGGNSVSAASFAYVSHLEKIAQGELLISSGEGLVFPKGFALGTIKYFDVNNTDYTYTTSIEPLIDVRTIEYCHVLKKGTEYVDTATPER